jgi:hypothetical protein
LQARYAGAVRECADGLHEGRRTSQECWTGGAAEAFRTRARDGGTEGDGVAEDAAHVGQALQTYADRLAAAQARMAQARETARAGGLPVSGSTIGDPGPAPVRPSPQMGTMHGGALEAWSAHEAMSRAYREAGELAADAGEVLNQAEQVLLKVLSDQLSKAPLTAFDGLAGLVAGYGKWAAKRPVLLRNARFAGRVASNTSMSYERMWRALLQQRDNLDEAEKALRRSTTPLAHTIDRLPDEVKSGLSRNLMHSAPGQGGVLARSTRAVLSRVPVAGAAVTAVGVGADIQSGKPVGKAVFSGTASLGAGVAAGALLASTPVGWSVAGAAVVGIGVGYAADWAWDAGVGDWCESAQDGVGDALAEGKDFVTDLF